MKIRDDDKLIIDTAPNSGYRYTFTLATTNNTNSISFDEGKKDMQTNTPAKIMPKIKRINFHNNIATEVVWSDGTTTKVVVGENDEFNPEFGLAMAIAKKFCGSYQNFARSLSRAKFRNTKTKE